MNFFFKKFFGKIEAYYYYFKNKNSRKYFFILILRKLLSLSKKLNQSKELDFTITEWCKKKKLSEKFFYKKLGLKKQKDFFIENRSYYLSAKLKQKDLNYKMGGMAHLNLIYNLIKYYKPKKILETGVAFGWSTLVLILSKTKDSELTSIDLSYPAKSSEKFVAKALPYNFKNKYKLLMGIDHDYLNLFKDKKKKFDFIHYDSDKSYNGRKKNYKLIWKILSKNGCFVSDDISDNFAFYEFVTSKKLNCYVLDFKSKYIGIVFK
jgi:predicted O-methyltransferase YrrM